MKKITGKKGLIPQKEIVEAAKEMPEKIKNFVTEAKVVEKVTEVTQGIPESTTTPVIGETQIAFTLGLTTASYVIWKLARLFG